MTAKKTTKKTLLAPTKNGTHGSILLNVVEVESAKTGRKNRLLIFDDAQVVMPGTWNINEAQFPDGLYEGQKLAAYWEPNNEGVSQFHLYEVK